MIDVDDMQHVHKLYREQGAEAALQKIERLRTKADGDGCLGTLVSMKANVLTDEKKYDEAIKILENNQSLFSSKTFLFNDIAINYYRASRIDDAIRELEKIPFEDELERYEALVHDARYFYFYLLSAHRGITITDEQIALFPKGYRQVTDRGERIGLEYLTPEYRYYEY